MRYLKIVGAVLALFFPSVLPAADGDNVNKGTNLQDSAPSAAKGMYNIAGFYLCHAKDSADSTCAEFDMQADDTQGMPDKVLIEISPLPADGCSAAWSVDINHGNVSTGAEHDLVTLTASTTSASIGSEVALGRFLNVDLATMTGCTADLFNVILWKIWRIK
jgi:hypothetical protein